MLGGQNIIDFVVEAGLGIRQNGSTSVRLQEKENGILSLIYPLIEIHPSSVVGSSIPDWIVGVVLSKSGETDFGKIEHKRFVALSTNCSILEHAQRRKPARCLRVATFDRANG